MTPAPPAGLAALGVGRTPPTRGKPGRRDPGQRANPGRENNGVNAKPPLQVPTEVSRRLAHEPWMEVKVLHHGRGLVVGRKATAALGSLRGSCGTLQLLPGREASGLVCVLIGRWGGLALRHRSRRLFAPGGSLPLTAESPSVAAWASPPPPWPERARALRRAPRL